MTKHEALVWFKSEILPPMVKQYRKVDKAALREAWNNFTDALCKDAYITDKQYNTWTCPW